jgi:transglutaminase-like putative cysteine protease/Flp pilus assembly protein TadD
VKSLRRAAIAALFVSIAAAPSAPGALAQPAGPPGAGPATRPKLPPRRSTPKPAPKPAATSPDEAHAPRRWTDTTPEETVAAALARARAGGDDAVAGLLVAAALDGEVAPDRVPRGLAEIARGRTAVADDARWLARVLATPPTPKPWRGLTVELRDAPPDRQGLVENLAILGPFQDTGGGLERLEGPEAPGQRWADADADHSWGAFEVRWRRALPATATARGLPLDLYVAPRAESCTYLASKITVPAGHRGPIAVHVASTGSIRLVFDGETVATSDDQHAAMLLDRLAVAIDGATAGPHLLALKVCTSSVEDAGRVRLRLSDGAGKPLAFATSADLSGVPERPPPSAAEPPRPKPGARPSRSAPPFTWRRIPTSLERAATVAPVMPLDRALVAATARVLGGADHAQSPRAPGQLDRVARDPAATGDHLAMAGWLSPFGSNKSGWLNQARERAAREGDRGAESFAQRALVASSLAGPMADWAIATSTEEPLASARDASARHLRALVAQRSGGAGTTQAALEDLLAIDRAAGGRASAALWRDVQRFARADTDVALRAARRLVALGQPRDPAYVRAHLPEGADAVERAVAVAIVEQRSTEDLVTLGRDLLRLGRVAWAREVLEVATRLGPNDAEAWSALAEALRASGPADAAAPAPDALARAALRRALALRPGDARAKAELAARQPDADRGGAAARDERWIVPPATFLARAKASPAKEGAVFSRQLHWVRVVTLHPDQRVSQLVQYAREIVVEPRTQAELFEAEIPNEGDETELLVARVHRQDGTVVEPEERGSGARAYVRWPDLHRGDVVEVVTRSWTGPIGRRGDPPFYFIDYVGSNDANPVLYNEVVVDSPAATPLAVEVINGEADRRSETREGDRLVQRFVWDAPPALPDEPFGPRLGEALPLVVGSPYRSWDEFLGWYRGAVRGFTEPDAQVRRLAADLTRGKATREQKVQALFEFVADDIRYVNYVSGEWWLPNRPQQLLARRQGDCDDKAMLLVSLLAAQGIEATPVLVQTRYTAMPSVLSGRRAAVPLFDHGIVFLPGEGGRPGTWLDATSPQSRIGVLPSMDARARALLVARSPARIVETPPSSPADHGTFAEWTVALEPTGAATIVATERHRGDAAFELRTALSEADARAQWVERYVQGRVPTIEVEPDVRFDPETGLLAYRARSAGLGRREGDEIAVPLAGSRTYTSTFAPLPPRSRTLPVVLPPGLAPSEQRMKTTIVAPRGYRFAELPLGGEVDGGELGRGKLEVKPGAPGTVVVDLSVVLDRSTIPLSEYAAFRSMLQRIDALTHQVVRLVPEAAAPRSGGEP